MTLGEGKLTFWEGRVAQRSQLFPCNVIDEMLKLSIVWGGGGIMVSEPLRGAMDPCPLWIRLYFRLLLSA